MIYLFVKLLRQAQPPVIPADRPVDFDQPVGVQLERGLLDVLALDIRQQRSQFRQHPATPGHPVAWRTR